MKHHNVLLAITNRRRQMLMALSTSALTGTLARSSPAHAQGNAPPARIGMLWPISVAADAARLAAAFRQGMEENGLIEGKHYILDVVSADGYYERLPALAKELVQRAPAVIMAVATPAVRAAQQATRTVPIVMISVSDPVGTGLVASLARPGGNTTGLSHQAEDTTAKFVEFVREFLPRAKRIALLINPGNPSHAKLAGQVRATALKFSIETHAIEAASPAALEAAFAAIAKQRPDALVVMLDAMLNGEHQRISAFALKNRIPAFGSSAEFAEAGILLAYGASALDMHRRSAVYVRKILAGAKPADLPIEQPTKFDMVINLKTAKALGIKIPQALLIQAERVIE